MHVKNILNKKNSALEVCMHNQKNVSAKNVNLMVCMNPKFNAQNLGVK